MLVNSFALSEKAAAACSCVHVLHELPQVPPFFGAELCDVEGTMVIKGRGACDTKVCLETPCAVSLLRLAKDPHFAPRFLSH